MIRVKDILEITDDDERFTLVDSSGECIASFMKKDKMRRYRYAKVIDIGTGMVGLWLKIKTT